jgi:hypothetical protein
MAAATGNVDRTGVWSCQRCDNLFSPRCQLEQWSGFGEGHRVKPSHSKPKRAKVMSSLTVDPWAESGAEPLTIELLPAISRTQSRPQATKAALMTWWATRVAVGQARGRNPATTMAAAAASRKVNAPTDNRLGGEERRGLERVRSIDQHCPNLFFCPKNTPRIDFVPARSTRHGHRAGLNTAA